MKESWIRNRGLHHVRLKEKYSLKKLPKSLDDLTSLPNGLTIFSSSETPFFGMKNEYLWLYPPKVVLKKIFFSSSNELPVKNGEWHRNVSYDRPGPRTSVKLNLTNL